MKAAFASLAATALALALPSPAGTGAVPAVPPAPDGLLVLAVLAPERVLVVDPRTGATAERELPGGTLCHGPVLAVGDRVVFSGSRDGRFVALSAPLGRTGRVRALGPADTITPSSTPGRIWLGHGHRLREVDASGGPTTRAGGALPRFGMLLAAIDDGVLIQRGRAIVLRRPRRAPVRIRDGWPLAAAGARFAWCPRRCRSVGVWSRDGARMLDPPPGIRPDLRGRAAFSPDGRRLALPVRTPHGARVAVIDVGRDGWSVVPGARSAGYWATAWSPSGRWLYFTGRGHRLLGSRGGAEPAIRLPVRTGGAVMSIASTRGSAGP